MNRIIKRYRETDFCVVCSVLFLLLVNVVCAFTPPQLRADGVLVFESEGGVADVMSVTENGSNYDVSIDSDGTVTNYTYPVSDLVQVRYLNMEMGSDMLNTTSAPGLLTEMSHYDAYAPKVSEMGDMFDLIRYQHVTVRSVSSGNWSSGSTWSTGQVPEEGARVLIESGHTVKVDTEVANAVTTVRVEGGITFSTTTNSSLTVDTMVTMMGSTFEMGTEADPIPEGITAKLIIEDQGDFVNTGITNPDYDPSHLGLGLIIHGSIEIYGMVRTGYATFDKAMQGTSSIKVDQLPSDWKVGDKIALAGTGRSAKEDEARLITALGGNVISFNKPLAYDHVTPRHTKEGLDLKIHVINLTRNAIITTQEEGDYRYRMNGPEPKSRGHVMFMHTNDVNIHYAGFYELGRTNKLQTMINLAKDEQGNITEYALNPIARYPCHFHRTGADGTSFGVVKGSAIDGSPGWGYVNHRGAAYIDNNVAYNVNGAAFISEIGNEIGTFINNVSIRTLGTGRENNTADASFGQNGAAQSLININEFGSAGDGFWFHSHMVVIKDNVASGFTGTGFHFWNQAIDGYDRDPTRESNVITNEDFIEGSGLLMSNNQAYGGNIAYAQGFGSQAANNARGFHRVEDFVAFQVNKGIRRKYTKHTEYIDMVLIGDLDNPVGEAAFDTHHNGRSQQFVRAHVEGFIYGLKAEKRKYAQIVKDGYFNNVYNIYLGFRHDRDENKYYINNTFGDLSEEALESVKSRLPGFDGVQVDYYALNDKLAGDVIKEDFEEEDDGGSEGKISNFVVSHNGQNYKVYLKDEQHPDSIPPVERLSQGNRTNAERVASGNGTSAYSSQMYDVSEVFEPSLPEVTYKNTVLGSLSGIVNTTGEPVRDIVIERPEDLVLGLDQDPLSLYSNEIFKRIMDDNTPTISIVSSSNESVATIVLNENGSIATLTPISIGTTSIILETDTDGETTFDLTVVASVTSPVANDDSYSGDFNKVILMPVLFNDTGDNALNGFEINYTDPSNGTVEFNSDGVSLRYTPNEGVSGMDSFTYTITDYIGKVSNVATVSLEVREEAPDYTITLLEGESFSLEFDSAVTESSAPSEGDVVYSDKILTYTQTASNHGGTDTFSYQVGGSVGVVSVVIDSETVLAQASPTVNAGSPILVRDFDDNGQETVQLDGSLSYDLDGEIVQYHWLIGGQEFTEVSPSVTLPLGNYSAVLTITDNDSNVAQKSILVDVLENPGIFFEKPVTADSEFDEKYFANNAVDGDTEISWRSKSYDEGDELRVPQNLFVDLEKRYEIESITLDFGSVTRQRSTHFKLYISDDEENWTEIGEYHEDDRPEQIEIFTFSPRVEGRYFRFEGIEYPGANSFRIYELTGEGTVIPNVLPVANAGDDKIVYDQDDSGVEDGVGSVVLDGSGSFDADLVELNYSWEDAFGNVYSGVSPEITLPVGLGHEIVLTVTDLDGATAQDMVIVDVVSGSENIALYKEVSPSYSAINDGVDTSYSSLDGGSNIVILDLEEVFTLDEIRVLWGEHIGVDFQLDRSNDGVNWEEMESVRLNADNISVVDVSGYMSRYVRLQVFRTEDASGVFDIEDFEVYKQPQVNVPPVADAGVDAVITDFGSNGVETLTLNGAFSSDVDGSIVKYEWSVPGYAVKEGVEVEFNFQAGETVVELTVTDNNGAIDTDEIMVTVDVDPNGALEYLLHDFEDGLAQEFRPYRVDDLEVVSNPDQTGLNQSDQVLKIPLFKTDEEGVSRVRNIGTRLVLNSAIEPGLRYMHCKVYFSVIATNTISYGGFITEQTVNTSINTWEDIVFDMGSTDWSGDDFIFRFYDSTEISGDPDLTAVVYIDDISFSDVATPNNVAPGSIDIPVSYDDYEATDSDGNRVETVLLDADGAYPNTFEIVRYEWDIPLLGLYASAMSTLSLEDLPVGVYDVSLTVVDINDNQGTVDFTITINGIESNVSPVANAGLDQVVSSDDDVTVTLDGTGSSDSDGQIIGYRWETSEGAVYNGASVDAVFPVGTSQVTLTVTDDDGDLHQDTVTIEVVASEFVAPVAVAGDDITVSDDDNSGSEEVVLDASASTDANDDIVSYTWDIPELGVYEGAIQTIDFPVGGYVIRLTVEDALGYTHEDQIIVLVSDELSVEEYKVVVPSNSGTLYVTGLSRGTEMAIYDMTGRLIKKAEWKEEGVSIKELSRGLYVLHLKIKGKKVFLKFFKK